MKCGAAHQSCTRFIVHYKNKSTFELLMKFLNKLFVDDDGFGNPHEIGRAHV